MCCVFISYDLLLLCGSHSYPVLRPSANGCRQKRIWRSAPILTMLMYHWGQTKAFRDFLHVCVCVRACKRVNVWDMHTNSQNAVIWSAPSFLKDFSFIFWRRVYKLNHILKPVHKLHRMNSVQGLKNTDTSWGISKTFLPTNRQCTGTQNRCEVHIIFILMWHLSFTFFPSLVLKNSYEVIRFF